MAIISYSNLLPSSADLALVATVVTDPACIPIGALVKFTKVDREALFGVDPFAWQLYHARSGIYCQVRIHVRAVGVIILSAPEPAAKPTLDLTAAEQEMIKALNAGLPQLAPKKEPPPPLRCDPECTPAAPCFFNPKCPGEVEREIIFKMRRYHSIRLCGKEVPGRLIPCVLHLGHESPCDGGGWNDRPRTGLSPLRHEGLAGFGVLSQGVRR